VYIADIYTTPTQPGDVGVQKTGGFLSVPHVLVDVIEERSVRDGCQPVVHVLDHLTEEMEGLTSLTPLRHLLRRERGGRTLLVRESDMIGTDTPSLEMHTCFF
jgi:hypothetical protein